MSRKTAIGAPAPQRMRILVCDDERHIVRLIQVNLEQAGCEVTTAYDGAEALGRLHDSDFDLIVLDSMMPIMDGFEVLKKIRINPVFERLPVILLTSKEQDKDVFEGYHYGADMVLTKPFNPEEIMHFLRR